MHQLHDTSLYMHICNTSIQGNYLEVIDLDVYIYPDPSQTFDHEGHDSPMIEFTVTVHNIVKTIINGIEQV